MKLKEYLSELKRRKVLKPALAYLLVAWIIIQAAAIVLPVFDAPPYLMKLILFILAIGLLVWIVFSWVYDITPEGIKKSSAKEQRELRPLRSSNRINILIITLLSIAIVLLIVNLISKGPAKKNSNSENSLSNHSIINNPKSIAVLPLFNVNQDNNLEYFSDGVTQEIIDELAKVKEFIISAFSSTVIYKDTKKNLQEIATELNVSLILSGSSRIFNDSVRLSIELIDPKSNSRIWNEQYDEVLSNAIRIQNDIAKQVARELNINLSPEEKSRLNKLNTRNSEAFDLLLKAKSEYTQLTREGFINSIDMLEKAIERDPEYEQAYSLLAWVHLLYGNAEINGDAGNSMTTIRKVKPLIDRAISLNPSTSDNFLIKGNLDFFYMNNLPMAVENVDKALDMNSWPNVPTNFCICTAISVYTAAGNLDRASELVKLSKKIDPTNKFVFTDAGIILFLKGETDQALYSFKEALEFSDIPAFNFYVGWAYYHLADYENALLYLNKAIKGEPDPLGFALAFLSNTHFKLGDMEMSKQYRNMILKRQSSGRANLNIPLAMISAARSNEEEAMEFLNKAYRETDFGFAWYLNVDPVFDELKDDPIFIELKSKIGFD